MQRNNVRFLPGTATHAFWLGLKNLTAPIILSNWSIMQVNLCKQKLANTGTSHRDKAYASTHAEPFRHLAILQ